MSATSEDLIQRRLEEERARLARELGIEEVEREHHARPVEHRFTASQRPHTTVLFGGLTWKHEELIHGALEGLGYRPEALPCPDVAAFQLGKEYGNNGQCNPTYFTVGNLVQFLQGLESDGMSRQDIIDKYIFVTAGACGPCRFGMYEAEYRLALRNSGFDGFRVLLFQQSGGFNQARGRSRARDERRLLPGHPERPQHGRRPQRRRLPDAALRGRGGRDRPGDGARRWRTCRRSSAPTATSGSTAAWAPSSSRCPPWAAWRRTPASSRDQLLGKEYIEAIGEVADNLRTVRGRPHPGEAHRQDHGRVLGPDHRGRRQLPHVLVPRARGRAGAGGADRHLDHVHDPPGQAGQHGPRGRVRGRGDARRLAHRQAHGGRAAGPQEERRPADARRGHLQPRVEPPARGARRHRRTSSPTSTSSSASGTRIYNSRAGGGEGHLEVAKNIYYSNKDLATWCCR